VQRNVVIFQGLLERAYQLGVGEGVSIFGMNDQIGPRGCQEALGFDTDAHRYYPYEADYLTVTVPDHRDDGLACWILVATPAKVSVSSQYIAGPVLQPVQLKDPVDVPLVSDIGSDRIARHTLCIYRT
jgi:hypothetical protein